MEMLRAVVKWYVEWNLQLPVELRAQQVQEPPEERPVNGCLQEKGLGCLQAEGGLHGLLEALSMGHCLVQQEVKTLQLGTM